MDWILLVLGLVLIIVATLDMLQTTIEHTGPGFLSSRLGSTLWKGFMLISEKNGRSRFLENAGLLIVSILIITWVLLIWIGYTCIFSFQYDSIIHSDTEIPASPIEKFYYTGYVLSTLGIGDFKASSDLWRLITVFLSISGLLMITLFISYLIPLLTAVTNKRRICSFACFLGDSPEKIIIKGWNGENLDRLNQHFDNLSWQILDLKEKHLLYPVLHYFHSTEKQFSTPISISILDEALTLILGSPVLKVKLDELVLSQLRSSINSYLDILEGTYIYETKNTPDIPNLDQLEKELNIYIDVEAVRDYFKANTTRRRLLNGMVETDGWKWEDIRD